MRGSEIKDRGCVLIGILCDIFKTPPPPMIGLCIEGSAFTHRLPRRGRLLLIEVLIIYDAMPVNDAIEMMLRKEDELEPRIFSATLGAIFV